MRFITWGLPFGNSKNLYCFNVALIAIYRIYCKEKNAEFPPLSFLMCLVNVNCSSVIYAPIWLQFALIAIFFKCLCIFNSPWTHTYWVCLSIILEFPHAPFVSMHWTHRRHKNNLRWNSLYDALLSPLLNPLEGSTMCSYGKLGLGGRSRLPAL
jgi:hypothetical protein